MIWAFICFHTVAVCRGHLTASMLTETDRDWNFSSQTKLDKENKIRIINRNHDSQIFIQHCTSHITFRIIEHQVMVIVTKYKLDCFFWPNGWVNYL